jgi:hypothetical protein
VREEIVQRSMLRRSASTSIMTGITSIAYECDTTSCPASPTARTASGERSARIALVMTLARTLCRANDSSKR